MNSINENLAECTAVRTLEDFPAEFPAKELYTLRDSERKYSRQFYSMYEHRLNTLKPEVNAEALRKWGHNSRKVNGKFIQRKEKILDIVSGEVCWVLGTIYTELKNKLNIFLDVEKGVDDLIPKTPQTYADEESHAVVMIEDESGRAILQDTAVLKDSGLVTGCVVGVLGIEVQAGVFEIMEVCYPKPAPQKHITSPSDGSWVAMVSGLKFEAEPYLDLRTMLLAQWLSGELGGKEDQSLTSNISRLLIVGNSIAQIETKENTDFSTTNNFGSKNISRFLPESLQLFNRWLSEVISSLPVTILPGEADPCEICLPQQPMHRSLLGNNAQYLNSTNLETLTNPAWIETFELLRILATAGQNVLDIMRYLENFSPSAEKTLKIMEENVRWRNIAPTAPDTLYCYPYDDKDPFVLLETPHAYIVGNQVEAGSKTVELEEAKCTLISVPSFKETGQIVLMHTSTLEVRVVSILQ